VNQLGQQAIVSIKHFNALSDGACLALDSYQRPYVWDEKKVNQLFDDLIEFQEQLKSPPDKKYYFGSLLLHDAKEKRFVIDGQQRLTTLSVLYSVINGGHLPDWNEFKYHSNASVKNIRLAKQVIQERLKKDSIDSRLFEHFEFTTITVNEPDLAFTFFDTQNNRGVPLKATDLLKAFHLRAIGRNESDSKQVELYQSHCAERWERVQTSGERNHHMEGNDFAPELFHYFLWRARAWRGSDVNLLESRDRLYTAFGEQTRPSNALSDITLYAAGSNKWGEALSLLPDNEYKIQMASLRIGQNAAHLPFAIRQPIERGVGFFLYAEKYAALLNWVFHDQSTGVPEIENMQELYKSVVCSLSIYLRRLFQLAVLMYVDRLGTHQLDVFAEWLNYRLAAIRLSQSDIRKETPTVYLRDSKINFLDVIAHSYDSIEVIDFLKREPVDDVFLNRKTSETDNSTGIGWKNLIESPKGVKGRYVKCLSDYYSIKSLEQLRESIGRKRRKFDGKL
jgi:hypothetical protein